MNKLKFNFNSYIYKYCLPGGGVCIGGFWWLDSPKLHNADSPLPHNTTTDSNFGSTKSLHNSCVAILPFLGRNSSWNCADKGSNPQIVPTWEGVHSHSHRHAQRISWLFDDKRGCCSPSLWVSCVLILNKHKLGSKTTSRTSQTITGEQEEEEDWWSCWQNTCDSLHSNTHENSPAQILVI